MRILTIFHHFLTFFIFAYRLNERVLKVEKHNWLDMIGSVPKTNEIAKWSSQDTSAWLMEQMNYIYISRRTAVRHLFSFWIVVDLNLAAGRQLLREAFEYVVSKRPERINLDRILTVLQLSFYRNQMPT